MVFDGSTNDNQLINRQMLIRLANYGLFRAFRARDVSQRTLWCSLLLRRLTDPLMGRLTEKRVHNSYGCSRLSSLSLYFSSLDELTGNIERPFSILCT